MLGQLKQDFSFSFHHSLLSFTVHHLVNIFNSICDAAYCLILIMNTWCESILQWQNFVGEAFLSHFQDISRLVFFIRSGSWIARLEVKHLYLFNIKLRIPKTMHNASPLTSDQLHETPIVISLMKATLLGESYNSSIFSSLSSLCGCLQAFSLILPLLWL